MFIRINLNLQCFIVYPQTIFDNRLRHIIVSYKIALEAKLTNAS